jgi:hypothetical protein
VRNLSNICIVKRVLKISPALKNRALRAPIQLAQVRAIVAGSGFGLTGLYLYHHH